jgi:hypothetical protein
MPFLSLEKNGERRIDTSMNTIIFADPKNDEDKDGLPDHKK